MKHDRNTLPVDTTIYFRMQFDSAPRDIQVAAAEALELFEVDPHHPSLHNHPLKDRYAGFRSINVTSDWRAIFREVSTATGTKYIFGVLGTHEQLYGRRKP